MKERKAVVITGAEQPVPTARRLLKLAWVTVAILLTTGLIGAGVYFSLPYAVGAGAWLIGGAGWLTYRAAERQRLISNQREDKLTDLRRREVEVQEAAIDLDRKRFALEQEKWREEKRLR